MSRHSDEALREMCTVAEEAVRLIQQRWRSALACRIRRRATARRGSQQLHTETAADDTDIRTAPVLLVGPRGARSSSVPAEDHPVHSDTVVEAAKHLCLAEAKARAARQIQRRWRQYREAVDELRSLRSAVSTRGSVGELSALCDFLEDDSLWSQDDDDDDDMDTHEHNGETAHYPTDHIPAASTTAQPISSIVPVLAHSPGGRAVGDTVSPPNVSVSSLLSSIFASASPGTALHGDVHSTARRRMPTDRTQDDDDDEDPVQTLRELAAHIIQGWFRRWIKRRRAEREIPPAALNALRVLQNRFRMVRLRRIVRERDAHQLVSRLQSLWRRRRELRQHFAALRRGREDAAARDIQRAYIRHRQRLTGSTSTAGTLLSPTTRSVGCASPVTPDTPPTLPLCIVCLCDDVQIALLPCGHAQVCVGCGSRCERCPTCRRLIALQIRIYL